MTKRQTGHLRRIYDFGLSPDEVAARDAAYMPLTLPEIEAMIVDEVDLATRGRWAGEPEPRRTNWMDR
jgi:hypothetical protein